MARASAVWLSAAGRRNSSMRISPGCGFGSRSVVVVDDLDRLRAALRPPEADAALVIDANAPLSRATALEHLEPIARRQPQIVQTPCRIQQAQLAQRSRLDVERQTPAAQPGPDLFRLGVAKADDHPRSI